MSHFIQGKSRTQVTLFPDVLDDFVIDENPVRVIDAFVDGLDLKRLGFNRSKPKHTGRPGYHPATLLKLYVYGYLNRIQSSRRLECETHRNVELMWLIERLTPDFKTIADFRKDKAKGIKNACRTFVVLCRKLNMFSDSMFAIDGSKFKAVNSKENNFTSSKLKFHIDRVEKHIDAYFKQLDDADLSNNVDVDTKTIEENIAWLKSKLAEFKKMDKAVQQHPDKQVSTTDPDSRLMKTKGMTRMVSYNIQSAVDTKHHLIISHEVTNVPDRGQLCNVAKEVQAVLDKKEITVIADKGYYSRVDIKDTLDNGMIALVSKGLVGTEGKGIFTRSSFKYDEIKDLYICPAGKILKYGFDSVEKGLKHKGYYNPIACKDCLIRSRCTKSKQGPRRIKRWIHEDEMEKMQTLLKAKKDTMLLRKQTVEHPFGTIKSWMGSTHFLCKGFKNVRTEMNLHVLAYNLKRMINIIGQ